MGRLRIPQAEQWAPRRESSDDVRPGQVSSARAAPARHRRSRAHPLQRRRRRLPQSAIPDPCARPPTSRRLRARVPRESAPQPRCAGVAARRGLQQRCSEYRQLDIGLGQIERGASQPAISAGRRCRSNERPARSACALCSAGAGLRGRAGVRLLGGASLDGVQFAERMFTGQQYIENTSEGVGVVARIRPLSVEQLAARVARGRVGGSRPTRLPP